MTSGICLAYKCGVSREPLTLQLEPTQAPSEVFIQEGLWGGGKAFRLTCVWILGTRKGLALVQINDIRVASAFADDVVLFGTTGARTGTTCCPLRDSTAHRPRSTETAKGCCALVLADFIIGHF